MELHVHKNTAIEALKARFSRHFPFLKLEIFEYKHHSAGDFQSQETFTGLYVDETSEFFKEGIIHFSPSTTVAELEQAFQIELGLAVKVFRRSVDCWTDVSQTSHLTLGRQNNMGAASAKAQLKLHNLFL